MGKFIHGVYHEHADIEPLHSHSTIEDLIPAQAAYNALPRDVQLAESTAYAADLDSWKRDQDAEALLETAWRDHQVYGTAPRIYRSIEADSPSPLPEYLVLAALGGVCAVLVYFALRAML